MDEVCVRVGCERATVVEPSERVCRLAVMFGLGVEQEKVVRVVPERELVLRRGEVVFVTGASGSGKSTLVRQVCAGVRGAGETRTCARRASLQSGLVELDGRVVGGSGDPGLRSQGVAQTRRGRGGEGRVVLVAFGGLGAVADGPLVEILGDDLAGACRLLSLAGLGDAFVMLRKPSELSDGQRYRLRLATAMAVVEGQRVAWALGKQDIGKPAPGEERAMGNAEPQGASGEGWVVGGDPGLRSQSIAQTRRVVEGDVGRAVGGDPGLRSPEAARSDPACCLSEDEAGGSGGAAGGDLYVVVADEFGATLDRVTAKAVARSVRKWVNRTGACFVAATTHDDLLEAMEPDVVVAQRLGGGMEVWERGAEGA